MKIMAKEMDKINFYTPGRTLEDSLYPEIYEDKKLAPKPYETSLPKVVSPFNEYGDVKSLVKAFEEASLPKAKSFVLAKMTPDLKSDRMEMLNLIKQIPEAIWYVAPHLKFDQDFMMKAIMENPNVYDLLSQRQQQDPSYTQAYVRGMVWRCDYLQREDGGRWNQRAGQVDYEAPVFKSAINERCDKDAFFSAENYKGFYEVLLDGKPYTMSQKGDSRDFDPHEKYNGAIAYLYAARMYAADKPELSRMFDVAEAEAILAKGERIVNEIVNDPRTQHSIHMAEAVAFAAVTMGREHREGDLLKAEKLVDSIEHAEEIHNKAVRSDIRDGLARFCGIGDVPVHGPNGYPSKGAIDKLMEEAERHPEIGISKEEMGVWWASRGEDLREMQDRLENGEIGPNNMFLKELELLARNHPEMIEERAILVEEKQLDEHEQTIGNR